LTAAQLRRLARQLRAGADGYETLTRAVERSVIGDGPAIERALENMDRLRRELGEVAALAEDPPTWLREVKLR
jgi:hypothetical protein